MSGFSIVWQQLPLLLSGFINTIIISSVSLVTALLLGCLLATVLMSSIALARTFARSFVDLMRCTPFLMLVYLVYYGLPGMGLRLNSWTTGLVAMVIYNSAYIGEILRGVWSGLDRETIDAGRAFGFHGMKLYRRIIFPQIFLSAGPLIGNQAIQIIKDSAFLTIIAIPELTHAASSIQSRFYVPFAAFISAIVLYWVLCLMVEAIVHLAGRYAEVRK